MLKSIFIVSKVQKDAENKEFITENIQYRSRITLGSQKLNK